MKTSSVKSSNLKASVCVVIFLVLVAFCRDEVLRNLSETKPNVLRCVKISPRGQSTEGIGAVLRRNQLALFIAEIYRAKVSFPNITSDHGYEIQEMFDSCPNPLGTCSVSLEKMILYRCPRADCRCLKNQVLKYIASKTKVCTVLQVETDRVRTMEYSGCTRGVLSAYFGTTSIPPEKYDALHYRAGDLAGTGKGKSFDADELFYTLTAMCKLSDRDIVVVTEGEPLLPKPSNCGGRIVLASDTSVQEAFQILQFASTVAVGTSSFATMMMEVARPTHVVVPLRAAALYEWVDSEYWTVIAERGALFHFDSKKMMVETVLSGAGLKARSLRTRKQEERNNMEFEVPSRKWTNDGGWSKTRRGL